MSDEPSKLAPKAHGGEPLDDIILGEDDAGALAPRAAQKPSVPPPIRAKLPEVPGGTAPSAPPPPPRKSTVDEAELRDGQAPKRPKMTLRIPDDEVARPSGATPGGGVPPAPASAPDDTLVEMQTDAVRAKLAAGIDTSNEPGWTPFQPEVARKAPPRPASSPDLRASARQQTLVDGRRASVVDAQERAPRMSVSDDIPVEMDLGPGPESDEAATTPHLPRVYDSEEIKIDESGDRISDTPEVEVSPEDLVSVESLPAGALPAQPTATQLMAGAPAPSRPQITTPSQPPVAPAPTPAGGVAAVPAAARKATAGPIVFVPPVGGLAPPPMTESAAARKKTRPWWEELFNDDYIRTMAKVSEPQIGAEVTFIEESLGCEAGAMILDLACGTGRHAVELAGRGYQVVGFDLSLAMLARASDEAQDRKQKLNFVQGDMREMTFEETFDGVYSWNTSFGFFDEEKNGAVIARVHKALKKGGQFLLDVVNRDYIIRTAPSLAWFEGDGCICMDEMQFDFITSRLKVKRTLMMDDGRTKEIEYSIRAYALHELGKMLHDNGFRVAEVSGRTGTPGVFFGCESPRTLILAEKR